MIFKVGLDNYATRLAGVAGDVEMPAPEEEAQYEAPDYQPEYGMEVPLGEGGGGGSDDLEIERCLSRALDSDLT